MTENSKPKYENNLNTKVPVLTNVPIVDKDSKIKTNIGNKLILT